MKQIILLLTFSTISLQVGPKHSDCSTLKNGVFYFYLPASSRVYKLIRNDSIQKEIDLQTKDTSFWNIKWLDSCTAKLKLLRITKKLSDNEKEFFYSHTTLMQVLNVGDKFYIFKASLDSSNSQYTAIDTVWFNPKSNSE